MSLSSAPRFSGFYRITGPTPQVKAVETTLERLIQKQGLTQQSWHEWNQDTATAHFVVGKADIERQNRTYELYGAQQNLLNSAQNLGWVGRTLMLVPVMICSAFISLFSYLTQPRITAHPVTAVMKALETDTFNLETGEIKRDD